MTPLWSTPRCIALQIELDRSTLAVTSLTSQIEDNRAAAKAADRQRDREVKQPTIPLQFCSFMSIVDDSQDIAGLFRWRG